MVLKADVGKRIYENRLKFKKDFLEAFRYVYDEFLIFIANTNPQNKSNIYFRGKEKGTD